MSLKARKLVVENDAFVPVERSPPIPFAMWIRRSTHPHCAIVSSRIRGRDGLAAIGMNRAPPTPGPSTQVAINAVSPILMSSFGARFASRRHRSETKQTCP